MSSHDRILTYSLAINEALHQTMEAFPDMIVLGQGLKSPWYVGNTARGLIDRFGDHRVLDTPVSENAITGMAVGAAIAGARSVVVHPRMDFMLYAFDPIVNEAANWHFMSGGTSKVPVVFWGIINRGGEQGSQHSQALHSLFAHIPGLKVVAPSTPHDAKGLMIAAVRDDNPVVFIDDRWLYNLDGAVPQEPYEVPLGQAVVRREGSDVTVVAFSHLGPRAVDAAKMLEDEGVSCEVVDPRTLKPLDVETIAVSARKTGRVLVCDVGWRSGGVGAEIAATIMEECWSDLQAPVRRLALPDSPAPASRTLEDAYYVDVPDIAKAVRALLRKNPL